MGDLFPSHTTASQLLAQTFDSEMERDNQIVLFGEDVGLMGGVWGHTRGLLRKYGERRVQDTPISEMGFIGMAVGAAQSGLRPIVDLMFSDFIGACLDQVYNAMAKNHYMSGGNVRVPVVVETAAGCIGAAAQHSQCLWGLFAHLPGMRVVVPSCPYDLKGLLIQSIESDDPVIFIEHKLLLLTKLGDIPFGGEVPTDRYSIPFGHAEIRKQGKDVTLVTLGHSVVQAWQAAEILASDGIEVELVDLRTVVPLDIKTVANSVKKTGRLLVVDEDYLSFGLSGEVVARVVENINTGELRKVQRLAVLDVPIPASLPLEQAVLPTKDKIVSAVHTMMSN
jgi:acetoin:2,6-dichlorophenolindophenol oxidoreductase subunit beta